MQKSKQDLANLRAEKILVEAMDFFCDEFDNTPTAFLAQGVLNHLSTLNELESKDEMLKFC